MRSFVIWLAAVIAGTAVGYILPVFIDIHPVVAVGGGMLIGSSLAITLNIMRSEEPHDDYYDPDMDEETE